MTPTALTEQLNNILTTLHLKQWNQLLSDWLTKNMPLAQRRTAISDLIHETDYGFERIGKDETLAAIIEQWGLRQLLSREFGDLLIAASLQYSYSNEHLNATGVYRRIADTEAKVASFIQLTETLPFFIGHEGVKPAEGSMSLQLWIVDDADSRVGVERVRVVLGAAQRANKILLQAFELPESALRVMYVESGTTIAVVLEVAIPVGSFLVMLFRFYFENIQWMKFRKMKMGADAVSSTFAVARTIGELAEKGMINPERAKMLEGRIIGAVDKLIMGGAFFETDNSKALDSSRLLLEQSEQLLLNPPEPEEPEPNVSRPEPEE